MANVNEWMSMYLVDLDSRITIVRQKVHSESMNLNLPRVFLWVVLNLPGILNSLPSLIYFAIGGKCWYYGQVWVSLKNLVMFLEYFRILFIWKKNKTWILSETSSNLHEEKLLIA